MSIYRYAGNSAVKEVIFHYSKDRQPVALLAAAQNASLAQLSAIRRTLKDAGWQSIAVHADGRPALQVTGFERDSQLDHLLQSAHFVEGQATITPQPGDDIKLTYGEKVRNMSLKLAGLFNTVGNTGMVFDGVKKGDRYRMGGGGLLLLGAVNLMRYGNAKPEHYERVVAEDMAEFIRSQGGTIPPGSRVSDLIQHKRTTSLAAAEKFLYEHPADVTLGVDSVGAGMVLVSGVKKMRKGEGWGGLGFGIGSLGLKLTSLILPEKPSGEEKPHGAGSRNPITKTIDWLKEKPLRFYGIGSLITDAFMGIDAYQQYKKYPGKKGYIYTAIVGTCYTIADIMYTLSSKDHVNDAGKFSPDEQRGIEAMAAESLAQQPETLRGPMAEKLGIFLKNHKEIKGDAGGIARSIIEQTQHMQENPWANCLASETALIPARS